MKKILFISHVLGGGGSERVLVNLANQLAANGYPVSILAFEDRETYPIRQEIRVSSLHGEHNKLKRIGRIRRFIREEKPDVVIAFEYFVNMQTILACLGLHVNLIVSERNDPAREGGKFPTGLIRNILYRFCTTLVCQTPDAAAYFPGSVRSHSVVIPNPLKEDLPQPWKGIRRKEVVNFCRLQPQKNLPLLLQAFADFHEKHGDYGLTVYGSGQLLESLQRQAEELGIGSCVTLHPAVPDVHQRIVDGAMFVSSSDYEGLSNSMIEAMAIGLPTICTDCPIGGARMMIRDGENGILTPVGDRKALADAMCRVAEDAALAEKLSCSGALLRQELTLQAICSRWEALF